MKQSMYASTLRNFLKFVHFKKHENTQGEAILVVKLKAEARIFWKSNTPPRVFFMFFKLHKSRKASHVVHVSKTISLFHILDKAIYKRSAE